MLVNGSANLATGDAIGSSPPLTFIPGYNETLECHDFASSNTPTFLNRQGES